MTLDIHLRIEEDNHLLVMSVSRVVGLWEAGEADEGQEAGEDEGDDHCRDGGPGAVGGRRTHGSLAL